jgi:type I restriction enzyme M protein
VHAICCKANPPFGAEWKPEEEAIRKEQETLGYDGRFGAGLPQINDGSFLFLQHMIAKRRSPRSHSFYYGGAAR